MRGSESQKISLKMHNFPEFSLLNFPKNFGLRYFSKLKKKKIYKSLSNYFAKPISDGVN